MDNNFDYHTMRLTHLILKGIRITLDKIRYKSADLVFEARVSGMGRSTYKYDCQTTSYGL